MALGKKVPLKGKLHDPIMLIQLANVSCTRLLMGSVSTFLVHNAPVPVSVVRPQKKAKVSKRKMTAAQKLSQSVRSGQLKVDEVAGAAPNSHT